MGVVFENENPDLPTIYDLSSVSQLPAASPEELTDESLLYVSISSDDPAYVSRKLRYGDLRNALSAGLSVERMRLSVETLADAV